MAGLDLSSADAITIGGKDVAALTDSHGVAWKTPGDIFVASWGNDTTGDGTVLHPVQTIGRADALARNGDAITLLTDITLAADLTLAHSVTLMGFKKTVELHLNRNVYLGFASGTNERIEKITVSCDGHGSSGDSYHSMIQCPASGTLTVENVLFDRCNDYDATQNHSRYGILGTNYRSGTLIVRSCEIRNSVCTGLATVRSNYDNLFEHITVGQNVQVITRYPGVVGSEEVIRTGVNEIAKVAHIGYISSESNVGLVQLGYYLNTNTDVHDIYGVGGINLTQYGSGRGILREINLAGTLVIKKPSYIGGKIRGTLTVTDTARAAADGNVFFEGYNGYSITQEDFASMTWGGAAGYHLSLENNKILLRANT